MSQTSKLMDYANGLNTRLSVVYKQKLNDSITEYNTSMSRINSDIDRVQRELQDIYVCPSNEHWLSKKYLEKMKKSPRYLYGEHKFQSGPEFSKNLDKTPVSMSQEPTQFVKLQPIKQITSSENKASFLPKINNAIDEVDQYNKPGCYISKKQNENDNTRLAVINGQPIKLMKSFTFLSKSSQGNPHSKPRVGIGQRSRTTIESNNVKQMSLNESEKRRALIKSKMSQFLQQLTNENDNEQSFVKMNDRTNSDDYINSIFLSKTDFDWKMKYLYTSRKSSLMDQSISANASYTNFQSTTNNQNLETV